MNCRLRAIPLSVRPLKISL